MSARSWSPNRKLRAKRIADSPRFVTPVSLVIETASSAADAIVGAVVSNLVRRSHLPPETSRSDDQAHLRKLVALTNRALGAPTSTVDTRGRSTNVTAHDRSRTGLGNHLATGLAAVLPTAFARQSQLIYHVMRSYSIADPIADLMQRRAAGLRLRRRDHTKQRHRWALHHADRSAGANASRVQIHQSVEPVTSKGY